MVKWNFPGNQDGQIKGVADAGIENFNGTELASLARENCQNSLDAALDDTDPQVLVEFERYFISADKIPGMIEYREILRQCKLFWDKSKSEKAKTFLKNAVSKANEKNGFVLRISDYNTTGLSDPYADSSDAFNFKFDGWNALIKIDGGANKDGDKAGAFGIGKSAPFSNSFYRLVFYRTLNQDNERASQGISRLMSYPDGRNMTSGVGYFGNPNGNNPVESINELELLNKRSETGTDVFVFGFKANSDWENEIITALLENFLMSISKGFFYGKGDEGSTESTSTKGTLGPTGDLGLRILKGKRKRKKLDSHRGLPDPEGKDVVTQKKPGGESNCPLKNVRIIKKSTGMYSVNFEIPHDVDYGRIELVTVGENGKSNRIHIKSAESADGCKSAKKGGDYIEAEGLSSSNKVKITVQLADSRDYAMEVNVYEHN